MPAFDNNAFDAGAFDAGLGQPTAGVFNKATTTRSELGGYFDMFIDPVTLDYVDTADGEWLETSDSRTIVMMMLDNRFGEDPLASNDGTLIKAELENDEGRPVTPEFVLSETLRALQVLVQEGIIADVDAAVTDSDGKPLTTEDGTLLVRLHYVDLASGSPVDIDYAPFSGG